MPYEKVGLATMVATSDEYVNKEEIAQRLNVHNRTVERLFERYMKKLKKSRRRRGRKIEYLWSDVLECAKIHTGIEKDKTPSTSIRKLFKKQQYLQELEVENEKLKVEYQQLWNQYQWLLKENERLQSENNRLMNERVPF
jgi:hypothetical protein